MDDSQLVARLRDKDDDAFVDLLRRHGPKLLAVARRLMRSEDDARDCFQESMLTVSSRIADFRGDSALSTWLHRIVVNTCLQKLRKASTRSEAFIDDLMPSFDDRDCRIGESSVPVPTPQVLLEQAETRRIVRAAIDDLPDAFRTVLVLRDIEGLSAAEVAELLEIERNLVNVRLHRARAALKKLLEPTVFGVGEVMPEGAAAKGGSK